jgi:hypothetical protein
LVANRLVRIGKIQQIRDPEKENIAAFRKLRVVSSELREKI